MRKIYLQNKYIKKERKCRRIYEEFRDFIFTLRRQGVRVLAFVEEM